jgi:hypothetical protein
LVHKARHSACDDVVPENQKAEITKTKEQEEDEYEEEEISLLQHYSYQ